MLRFYNTLTRQKDVFQPLQPGQVSLYTCGPTVYNHPHIGNYRAYIFEDLLRRYLQYRGYTVMQVMNLTDVEDKIIRDSQKAGLPLRDFTAIYTKTFFEDLRTLHQAIGGSSSDRPLLASELQADFPGALPAWLRFVEAHPVWTIVIGAPLTLVAITIGRSRLPATPRAGSTPTGRLTPSVRAASNRAHSCSK